MLTEYSVRTQRPTECPIEYSVGPFLKAQTELSFFIWDFEFSKRESERRLPTAVVTAAASLSLPPVILTFHRHLWPFSSYNFK